MTLLSRLLTTRRRPLAPLLLVGALVFAALPSPTVARPRPVAAVPLTSLARVAAVAASQELTPAQIRGAYALPTTGARHQVVAIVSAYDDPGLLGDLAAYDRRFGLPACTTSNGCVRKLTEQGAASPLPAPDPTGGQYITESALGTEIVHGVCQSCRLLLVEATQASRGNLSNAVAAAGRAGATVIVTTFTPSETIQDPTFTSSYSSPHATIVAAAGDPPGTRYGYTGPLNFPAALPNVLAVGGTTLSVTAPGRRTSERAWDGTVSGCSSYEKAPAWQQRIRGVSGCGTARVVADISAVADPGALVHIGGIGTPGGPWYVAHGTSLSAPVIGAMIGLAGSAGSGESKLLYDRQLSDPAAFHDIVTGQNAPGCRVAICRAGRGWDGPTGLGTPAGLEAFLPGGPVVSARHPQITVSTGQHGLTLSRGSTTALSVSNGNPFRISGSVVIRRTLRIAGRPRLVTFATSSFQRGSLATGSLRLTIAPAARALLTRPSRISVWAFVTARGASGRNVTVKQRLILLAP